MLKSDIPDIIPEIKTFLGYRPFNYIWLRNTILHKNNYE